MVQETKTMCIVFASMTNYSNWKRQIALATNEQGFAFVLDLKIYCSQLKFNKDEK